MSIALIATVVALVLGHLAPSFAAAVRQYGWYGDLVDWLNGHFGEHSFWRGRWGIALALAPGLLIVGLLQLSLEGRLAGIAELLFGVAILFYAWGPRDLDRDVGAALDATDATARRDAMANLTDMQADAAVDGAGVVEPVFRAALRRWFGVLFWFLVLGPFGAVLYRLSVLSAAGDVATRMPDQTRGGARTWLSVLEWPVAQLMTLSLALVGDFDGVLGAWRSNSGTSARLDNRFLGAAARASVRSELAEEAGDGVAADHPVTGLDDDHLDATGPVAALPELHDAMSLVWRCLLVWLAALALFVIAGFVS